MRQKKSVEERKESQRRWREANRGRLLEYSRAKYRKNRDKILSELKENRPRVRNQKLLREYGITLEAYDRMLAEQGGRCRICEAQPDPTRPLCVDHDHDTGYVRGLLCSKCNSGIGLLGDAPITLLKAYQYLEDALVNATPLEETA